MLDLIEEVAAICREHPASVVGVQVHAGIENFLLVDDAEVVVGIGGLVSIGVVDAARQVTPITNCKIMRKSNAPGEIRGSRQVEVLVGIVHDIVAIEVQVDPVVA